MSEEMKIKGFMDTSNVSMCNKQLKKLGYDDGVESVKDVPDLSFESIAIGDGADTIFKFLKLLNAEDIESVELSIYNNKLILSTDIPSAELILRIPVIEGSKPEFNVCKYSVAYLIAFFSENSVKTYKENPRITFSFGTEYPLRIDYGKDWYVLAPRVEN